MGLLMTLSKSEQKWTLETKVAKCVALLEELQKWGAIDVIHQDMPIDQCKLEVVEFHHSMRVGFRHKVEVYVAGKE